MLAVWGPLMVGGSYYAAVGKLPWGIVVASIPYGLLCTAVLMGKHIDKIPWDTPEGIRTLPVIMGEPPRPPVHAGPDGRVLRDRRRARRSTACCPGPRCSPSARSPCW